MDPNSAHQQWSEWTFTVVADESPSYNAIVDNVRRVTAALFGPHGQVRVDPVRRGYRCQIQAETSRDSVMDPQWRIRVKALMTMLISNGWKGAAKVLWDEPRLLAGSPEDGRPVCQWLIMPSIDTTLKMGL
jgi:hypothetical protein